VIVEYNFEYCELSLFCCFLCELVACPQEDFSFMKSSATDDFGFRAI
jgi:hypothetical protein